MLERDYTLTSVVLGVFTYLWIHVNEPGTALQGLAIVGGVPWLAAASVAFLSSYKFLSVHDCHVLDGTFYLCIYLFTILASVSIYRLSHIHPLYHVPGPWYFKLSKLSGMWVSYTGHQHLVLKKLHEQYGDVVRIGPNEVSINNSSIVNAGLGASGLPKGQYYKARQDPSAPSNLVVLQGEAHANRRRIWNRGMSSQSLKDYEEIIARRANQLADKLTLKAGKGETIDLSAWISFFSFDFMGDMAFGGGFELLRDEGDSSGVWKALDDFAVVASVISHMPWLARSLALVPLPARDRLRQYGISNATRRMKTNVSRKDLWYHLMDEAGLEKQKPPVRDVVSDGATAIIAGADTTASALASLFMLLLTHPQSYSKVQEEINATFPAGADPMDTSKHNDGEMPWLNACLNEALRLYPPVPTNGPREVPKESNGKVLAGMFIPPGTQVYIPPYCLHRDERNFSPSPNSFRPHRWMKNLNEVYLTNEEAFIPFSYGPYNCVGRNLAKQELLMVSSLLMYHFDFSLVRDIDEEKKDWPLQLHDHFVTTRGPLLVRIKAKPEHHRRFDLFAD